MSITAMKQALEALEDPIAFAKGHAAKAALRTAIAEAEKQEPLGYWNAVQGWVELPEDANQPTAWVYPEALEAFRQGKPWTAYGADGSGPHSDGIERIPLYTTPPAAQRQWVGLTDEQISDLWCKVSNTDFVTADTHVFARAIEAAHGIKEKNT